MSLDTPARPPETEGPDAVAHHDPYERRWLWVSVALLVTFAASIAITGFAFGFQLPGDEGRVDPRTVADTPPWDRPGIEEIADGEYEVYMLARQYLYEPNQITVPVGSTVTFYVTSVDVQHGFKLQDTNVNLQVVPGHISKLTVEFDREGEFPYICNEFCGIGHAAMFGTLTVTGG